MNRTMTVVLGALLVGLGATLSVLAGSEELPELKFYQDHELVSSRSMTSSEYQKWQKLQEVSRGIETMSLPIEEMSEDIANQSIVIARMSTKIAAIALKSIYSDQQFDDEGLEHQLDALTTALNLDVAEIEQEAEYLEQQAKLVERAAHDFKNEIEDESSSIRYDNIQVDDSNNSFSILSH